MIAQFKNLVLVADGWDVRVLRFRDSDAARSWTYGAGIPRVSRAHATKMLGAEVVGKALSKVAA